MSDSFERRKHKRCTAKVSLKVKNDKLSSDGYTYDIGVGGVRAFTRKPFPINSKVYVTLKIPKEKEFDVDIINIIGEVVRVEEVSIGEIKNAIGIKTQNISEQDILTLKEFLKKIFCIEKRVKTISENTKKRKDAESNESKNYAQKESVDKDDDVEIRPFDESMENVKNTLKNSDDYTASFTKIVKTVSISAVVILVSYLSYYIIMLLLKLSGSH